MNTNPDPEPIRYSGELPPSKMETIAQQLVALVEEFEAAISKGQHIPPSFAERLGQLRQTAERLISP